MDLDTRLLALVSSHDPDDWTEVGCDLADAGRFREAESCFRRAEQLGDEYGAFNLGNALLSQQRWAEAVVAYERAVAVGVTDAWLNLGNALLALDDPGGTMYAFEQSAAAGDLGGMLALAFELWEQGERDRALSAAAQAAEGGHQMAGGVVACWRWCTSLDPALEPALRAGAAHFPGARGDLAQLLIATGRVAEGRAQLSSGRRRPAGILATAREPQLLRGRPGGRGSRLSGRDRRR
jgi:tetratricopeptide (TPR) repeat protein